MYAISLKKEEDVVGVYFLFSSILESSQNVYQQIWSEKKMVLATG